MRDARRELAHRREAGGALHVLLEPAQLGEVLEVDDAADHLVMDVEQGRDRDAQRDLADHEVRTPHRVGGEAGQDRVERLADDA